MQAGINKGYFNKLLAIQFSKRQEREGIFDTYENRTFAYDAAVGRNKLPIDIKTFSICFKTNLKTFV
jgi:hypothetical protein